MQSQTLRHKLCIFGTLILLITQLQATALAGETDDAVFTDIPGELLQLPSGLHLQYLKNTGIFSDSPESTIGSTVLCAIELNRGDKTSDYWIEMRLDSESSPDAKPNIGTLYTSTGRKFVFESTQTRLFTKLAGKINEKHPDKTPVDTFDLRVNGDYLSLGLNRLHEFFEATKRYRLQFPDSDQLSYTIRSSPFEDPSQLFPPEVLQISQLSEASERAFVGALPAFTEFFKIIFETDGLKDLLVQLIPKRKLLALLNPFSNTDIVFTYGTPAPHQIDATPLQLGIDLVGTIPVILSINDEPLLHLQFYTTDPIYEWRTCAGIAAIHITSVPNPDHSCIIRTFPKSMILGRLVDHGFPE